MDFSLKTKLALSVLMFIWVPQSPVPPELAFPMAAGRRDGQRQQRTTHILMAQGAAEPLFHHLLLRGFKVQPHSLILACSK